MGLHCKDYGNRNMQQKVQTPSSSGFHCSCTTPQQCRSGTIIHCEKKHKTDMRSSLKLDGTLSSILTTKNYNPESLNLCYKWRSDKDLLDLFKKATISYNNEQTQK